MAERSVKLPDVGEGIAEAELIEWHVKVGDLIREDDLIAAVMTDKATVEIPSPVAGEVLWLGAECGDVVAIGSVLVRIAVAGEGPANKATAAEERAPREPQVAEAVAIPASEPSAKAGPAKVTALSAAKRVEPRPTLPGSAAPRRAAGDKPLASPAVRLKARDAGIDLRRVTGSGPAGRIIHADLDAFIDAPDAGHASGSTRETAVTEVKIAGLRRRIAERMSLSKSRIPHITIVEEVNMTPLEDLRATLNRDPQPGRPKLTLLPFLMRAMVKALGEQPSLNALFDDDAGIVRQHAGIHIGIATQTPAGLMVPVVRHAEARDVWEYAGELSRLAESARNGTATREELTGSTITITSLGALGGIATTPVINYPEVAIVGVNKMMVRPMWDGASFVPRKMMNLSSSFDHRVVDGWDAAVFVQRLKDLLENPAMMFLDS